MFESIRKHSKIVMIVLILLVIPSFVLVGIDTSLMSNSPAVARVDGQDITQDEWDLAHRNEADRLRAQQPQLDARLLDSPEARYATLERLVRDRVMQAALEDMRLYTTDDRLAEELQNIPQVAALRKPDGSLDVEGYRALVGAQGMTPEGFEASIRRDLAIGQVMGVVASSSFAPAAQAKAAMDALFQQREVRVAMFDPAVYRSKVEVTEADLKAFYDKNTEKFRQPEEVSIEYVELTLDDVITSVELSEDDLKTYYQQNLSTLAQQEERRASHILLSVPDNASEAEREKLRAQAQELHAQLEKEPAQFAELAKKHSTDPGSASQGGDLGFFGRGAMVKPFEDAAYALALKAISPVVQSDFGFHIIQLTEIRAPKAESFESMRPRLEADLRNQQAQRKFVEVADTFSNLVYEQSDSLQPVAEQLKLKIKTAQHISQTPVPGAGVLSNERLIRSLYEPEALNNKRNTEALDVGANHLVAARVTEHTPAQIKPFEGVQKEVQALYVNEKAAQLAQEAGKALLGVWSQSPDAPTAAIAKKMVIARDQTQGLPVEVITGALSVSPEKLPSWKGIDLGAAGYAVVQVEQVIPQAVVQGAAEVQRQQMYAQQWMAAEVAAYYEVLKQRYKVQFKVQQPSASKPA